MPAILRSAVAFHLALLLVATAGCGKEDRSNHPTTPSKAVATAEGQTQVVKPKVDAPTNRVVTP